MNWGTKITISFVIFGILMATLIIISVNQEINLVAEDYYKQEIEYEAQIQRMKNSINLTQRPEMKYNSNTKTMELVFPAEILDSFKVGEIHFFRPSDHKLDEKVEIALDENGKQSFDLNKLKTGQWEVKLTWESEALGYYEEKKIFI